MFDTNIKLRKAHVDEYPKQKVIFEYLQFNDIYAKILIVVIIGILGWLLYLIINKNAVLATVIFIFIVLPILMYIYGNRFGMNFTIYSIIDNNFVVMIFKDGEVKENSIELSDIKFFYFSHKVVGGLAGSNDARKEFYELYTYKRDQKQVTSKIMSRCDLSEAIELVKIFRKNGFIILEGKIDETMLNKKSEEIYIKGLIGKIYPDDINYTSTEFEDFIPRRRNLPLKFIMKIKNFIKREHKHYGKKIPDNYIKLDPIIQDGSAKNDLPPANWRMITEVRELNNRMGWAGVFIMILFASPFIVVSTMYVYNEFTNRLTTGGAILGNYLYAILIYLIPIGLIGYGYWNNQFLHNKHSFYKVDELLIYRYYNVSTFNEFHYEIENIAYVYAKRTIIGKIAVDEVTSADKVAIKIFIRYSDGSINFVCMVDLDDGYHIIEEFKRIGLKIDSNTINEMNQEIDRRENIYFDEDEE
ncbi:MAG: hypothetical protein OEY49_10525 [Candidatus Heimdallarchaeota archaeon]|nr:hypothetical protein [Candidatus Heimdallarchaeota archaeon]